MCGSNIEYGQWTSHGWLKYFSAHPRRRFHNSSGILRIKFAAQGLFYRNISISVHKEMAEVRVGARVPILTRHIFRLILPGSLVHLLHRAYRAYRAYQPVTTTPTTTTIRTYIPQHVRIFVFGWDHVWIKWQHGSPADAGISALCAAQAPIHTSLRSSWAHERIHSVVHTNTWGYTCPRFSSSPYRHVCGRDSRSVAGIEVRNKNLSGTGV